MVEQSVPGDEELSGDDGHDRAIRRLLAEAGMRDPEPLIAFYSAIYPRMRAMAAALHGLPAVRYEEPATVYAALPEGWEG